MSFIPCNTLCYAWCFPCRHQCTWKVISETWPVSFLSDEKPLFSLRKSHMLMDLGLHEWPSACISSLIFIFINLSYIHDLSCHNLKQWGIKFNPIWKILNKKQIKSQHLQCIWLTLTPAKDKKWEAIKITILVITFRTLQYTPPPLPWAMFSVRSQTSLTNLAQFMDFNIVQGYGVKTCCWEFPHKWAREMVSVPKLLDGIVATEGKSLYLWKLQSQFPAQLTFLLSMELIIINLKGFLCFL